MRIRLSLGLLALICAFAVPASAGDREQVLAVMKPHLSTECGVMDLRIASTWARVDTGNKQNQGEGCASYVLHRLASGRWILAAYEGSHGYDASLPFHSGAPVKVAAQLALPYKVPPEEVGGWTREGPMWPYTSKRACGDKDFLRLTAWQLNLMRNEIHARHGRTFRDPDLRAYFESRAWYKPDAAYTDQMLTAIEQANVRRILDYQKKHDLML